MVALPTDQVKRGGKSLMVVTHDERLASLADFVLHIRDGRLAPSEVPASLS